jgi:hypothetical protein
VHKKVWYKLIPEKEYRALTYVVGILHQAGFPLGAILLLLVQVCRAVSRRLSKTDTHVA